MVYKELCRERISSLGMGTMRFPRVGGRGSEVSLEKPAEMIDYTLKRLDIEKYFDSILTCHDVNSGKNQSAIIYEQSLKNLDLNKEDVVVFEDAPHAIKTAKYVK